MVDVAPGRRPMARKRILNTQSRDLIRMSIVVRDESGMVVFLDAANLGLRRERTMLESLQPAESARTTRPDKNFDSLCGEN